MLGQDGVGRPSGPEHLDGKEPGNTESWWLGSELGIPNLQIWVEPDGAWGSGLDDYPGIWWNPMASGGLTCL